MAKIHIALGSKTLCGLNKYMFETTTKPVKSTCGACHRQMKKSKEASDEWNDFVSMIENSRRKPRELPDAAAPSTPPTNDDGGKERRPEVVSDEGDSTRRLVKSAKQGEAKAGASLNKEDWT